MQTVSPGVDRTEIIDGNITASHENRPGLRAAFSDTVVHDDPGNGFAVTGIPLEAECITMTAANRFFHPSDMNILQRDAGTGTAHHDSMTAAGAVRQQVVHQQDGSGFKTDGCIGNTVQKKCAMPACCNTVLTDGKIQNSSIVLFQFGHCVLYCGMIIRDTIAAGSESGDVNHRSVQ